MNSPPRSPAPITTFAILSCPRIFFSDLVVLRDVIEFHEFGRPNPVRGHLPTPRRVNETQSFLTVVFKRVCGEFQILSFSADSSKLVDRRFKGAHLAVISPFSPFEPNVEPYIGLVMPKKEKLPSSAHGIREILIRPYNSEALQRAQLSQIPVGKFAELCASGLVQILDCCQK